MLNSKIGFKLTFGVVLTVLVAIGIFAYFNIQSENKSLLMEVERHANQFSEHLKADMNYDMLHQNRQRIREGIRRIGKQESVDHIRVFNKPGEIVYSSDPDEVGVVIDMNADICSSCHGEAGGALPFGSLADEAGARRAYEGLLTHQGGGDSARGPLVDSGSARTSRLIWQLFGQDTSESMDAGAKRLILIAPGHVDLLSDEERRVFVEWVDLGAQWDLPPEVSGGREEGGTP